MADLGELRDVLALALRDPDPVEAVRAVCRASAQALPVDGAAISTMNNTQHRETVCATDGVAQELEELQFTLGEGPCFEAFFTGMPVLVPDLDAAPGQGWPVYQAEAVEKSPARAVFVFPLKFGSLRIGTLGAYRTTPGPLEGPAAAAAAELADIAALVLLGIQDPAGTLAQLQREASTRGFGMRIAGHDQVHVAAGVLAEQLELPPAAAFDRMRGYAFTEGRLLVDVAADVLAHRLRLDRVPDNP